LQISLIISTSLNPINLKGKKIVLENNSPCLVISDLDFHNLRDKGFHDEINLFIVNF